VIQERWFPTSCGRVKFSADGESMLATGCYPPQSRLYELRELSLKFSHHFVAGPLGRTRGLLWQRRSSAALSGSAAADRALCSAAQRQPLSPVGGRWQRPLSSIHRAFRLPSRCRRPSCGLCAYPAGQLLLQADIVQFQILSTDWKKQAYLLSDRTIELHSQASACCVAAPCRIPGCEHEPWP
jgi:hypothetical protein